MTSLAEPGKVDQFQAGFQGGALDPFVTGKVAMKIDVENSVNIIARFNPDLNFGVAPAPVPDERAKSTTQNVNFDNPRAPVALSWAEWKKLDAANKDKKGRFAGQPRYITWSGGFSWAIPVGAKNVELAWEFIKFMNSPEAGLIGAKAQKEYNRKKGRPFVPLMHANQRVNEAVFAKYAPEEPKFKNAMILLFDDALFQIQACYICGTAAMGRTCPRI